MVYKAKESRKDYIHILYNKGVKINSEFFYAYIDRLSDKSLRLLLKLMPCIEPQTNYLKDNIGNPIILEDCNEIEELKINNIIQYSDVARCYVVNPFLIGGDGEMYEQ